MPTGTFFFEFGGRAQLELGFGLELDLLLLLCLFSPCPAVLLSSVLCSLLCPANKPVPVLRRPRTTTHKLGCARPLACRSLASTSTSTTSSKPSSPVWVGRAGSDQSRGLPIPFDARFELHLC